MKQYRNGMKATEFSKKQISVIYGCAKRGNLKVEKWFMSELYDLADYYGMDANRSIEWNEMYVKEIINLVFANDLETAQEKINWLTNNIYERLSIRNQKSANRALVA